MSVRTNGRWKVNCWVCGESFTAKRIDAKTCSARCRQRLKRRLAAGLDGIHPAAGFAVKLQPIGTGPRKSQVGPLCHKSVELAARPRDASGNYVTRRGRRRRRQEG